MKILSFGNIPKWAGGRQGSGLANVIYQLAKNMSEVNDVQVALSATDVFVERVEDGQLTILGWTKSSLLRYALCYPFLSIRWLFQILLCRLKYGSIISIMGYFFKGLHLSRCVRSECPDVVHLHAMGACVYDKVIPQKVKIIVTIHGIIGDDPNIPNHSALSKMERAVCKSERYAKVVFIADKLMNDFSEFYHGIRSKTTAIPNAYDGKVYNYIPSIPHDKLTLITVASLSDNKGQLRVLNAIEKAGVNCRYVCVGSGDSVQVKRNQDFASQHGIDYEYVGLKLPAEIQELYSRADYMILPSSTEGFGLVFLEAIACGVPVILPEHLPIVQEHGIIQPEVNAVLLKGSDTKSIAAVLPELINYRFDRKGVSESIRGYTWKDIANKYVEIIKQL